MTLAYNQGLYINNARYTYYIILSCTRFKPQKIGIFKYMYYIFSIAGIDIAISFFMYLPFRKSKKSKYGHGPIKSTKLFVAGG